MRSLTLCSWKIITRRGSSIFLDIFSLEDELKHTRVKRGGSRHINIERLYSLDGDQVWNFCSRSCGKYIISFHHIFWMAREPVTIFHLKETVALLLFDLILGIASKDTWYFLVFQSVGKSLKSIEASNFQKLNNFVIYNF